MDIDFRSNDYLFRDIDLNDHFEAAIKNRRKRTFSVGTYLDTVIMKAVDCLLLPADFGGRLEMLEKAGIRSVRLMPNIEHMVLQEVSNADGELDMTAAYDVDFILKDGVVVNIPTIRVVYDEDGMYGEMFDLTRLIRELLDTLYFQPDESMSLRTFSDVIIHGYDRNSRLSDDAQLGFSYQFSSNGEVGINSIEVEFIHITTSDSDLARECGYEKGNYEVFLPIDDNAEIVGYRKRVSPIRDMIGGDYCAIYKKSVYTHYTQ